MSVKTLVFFWKLAWIDFLTIRDILTIRGALCHLNRSGAAQRAGQPLPPQQDTFCARVVLEWPSRGNSLKIRLAVVEYVQSATEFVAPYVGVHADLTRAPLQNHPWRWLSRAQRRIQGDRDGSLVVGTDWVNLASTGQAVSA